MEMTIASDNIVNKLVETRAKDVKNCNAEDNQTLATGHLCSTA